MFSQIGFVRCSFQLKMSFLRSHELAVEENKSEFIFLTFSLFETCLTPLLTLQEPFSLIMAQQQY